MPNFFQGSEETGFEGGAVRVAKQAGQAAVKTMTNGVTDEASKAKSTFFQQLLGDLAGPSQDTSANASPSPSIPNPTDQGIEQPDAAIAQMKQLQQAAQSAAPASAPTQAGDSSSYPGVKTPEEQSQLQQAQQKLRELQKQHKETYSDEFTDIEKQLKKQEEQEKQVAQQKQQEEEEEKKKKEQEKKQEEEQRKVEEENKNAKKMEAPAGAG